MNPLFAHRGRLALYVGVWLAFGALLAAVLSLGYGPVGIGWMLLLIEPLVILFAFESLSLWYLVRRLPLGSTPAPRLLSSHLVAALLSVTLWLVFGYGWSQLLPPWGPGEDQSAGALFVSMLPLLALVGTIAYVLALLVQYLLDAGERSREAERRTLALELAARDAELKSLKAQLDPHFLFNSLNSVAALIGTDAPAARRMCFLMSGFFRKSLGLARRAMIPLAEEVYLAETFLAIEQVRFGERLRTRFEIAEETLTLAVPPLLLQPLVENAVHHGIAHLIEGGEVVVRARSREGRLELEVENPCDPERPPSRGAGVGLGNARSRLETLFAHRSALEIESHPERFRVRALLPLEAAPS